MVWPENTLNIACMQLSNFGKGSLIHGVPNVRIKTPISDKINVIFIKTGASLKTFKDIERYVFNIHHFPSSFCEMPRVK